MANRISKKPLDMTSIEGIMEDSVKTAKEKTQQQNADVNVKPIEEPEKKKEDAKKGRPYTSRTVNRNTGKVTTVVLMPDMKRAVEDVAFMARVDQGDIIRTAIDEFIRKFTKDNMLTSVGKSMVERYIDETSEK